MIFVTVGNATQEFRRLLDAVEAVVSTDAFSDETVFIQTGNNPRFRSSRCRTEAFMPMERFAELIRQADVVVCHGGAGTLMQVLQSGKSPVVMPRRKRYGEIVDDHQVELVQALAAGQRVVPAYEPEELPGAIEQARTRAMDVRRPGESRMLSLVQAIIEDFMGRTS